MHLFLSLSNDDKQILVIIYQRLFEQYMYIFHFYLLI